MEGQHSFQPFAHPSGGQPRVILEDGKMNSPLPSPYSTTSVSQTSSMPKIPMPPMPPLPTLPANSPISTNRVSPSPFIPPVPSTTIPLRQSTSYPSMSIVTPSHNQSSFNNLNTPKEVLPRPISGNGNDSSQGSLISQSSESLDSQDIPQVSEASSQSPSELDGLKSLMSGAVDLSYLRPVISKNATLNSKTSDTLLAGTVDSSMRITSQTEAAADDDEDPLDAMLRDDQEQSSGVEANESVSYQTPSHATTGPSAVTSQYQHTANAAAYPSPIPNVDNGVGHAPTPQPRESIQQVVYNHQARGNLPSSNSYAHSMTDTRHAMSQNAPLGQSLLGEDSSRMSANDLKKCLFSRSKPYITAISGISPACLSLVKVSGNGIEMNSAFYRSSTSFDSNSLISQALTNEGSKDELLTAVHTFIDLLNLPSIERSICGEDRSFQKGAQIIMNMLRQCYANPTPDSFSQLINSVKFNQLNDHESPLGSYPILKCPPLAPLLPNDLLIDEEQDVPETLFAGWNTQIAKNVIPSYSSSVVKRLFAATTCAMQRTKGFLKAAISQGVCQVDTSGCYQCQAQGGVEFSTAVAKPDTGLHALVVTSQWQEAKHELLLWRILTELYLFSGKSNGNPTSTGASTEESDNKPNKHSFNAVDLRIVNLLLQASSPAQEAGLLSSSMKRVPPSAWKVTKVAKNSNQSQTETSISSSKVPDEEKNSTKSGIFSFFSRVVGSGSNSNSKVDSPESDDVSSYSESPLSSTDGTYQDYNFTPDDTHLNPKHSTNIECLISECCPSSLQVLLNGQGEEKLFSESLQNPISQVPGANIHADVNCEASRLALEAAQHLVLEGRRVEAVQLLAKSRLWSFSIALATASEELGLVPKALVQKILALYSNNVFGSSKPLAITSMTPQMLQQGHLLREVPPHVRLLNQRKQVFAQRIMKETSKASVARASARFLGLASLAEPQTPSVLRDWPLTLASLYSLICHSSRSENESAVKTVLAAREAIVQLGDILWKVHSSHIAAQICYLLAGKLPPAHSVVNVTQDTRLYSLGADHRLNPADESTIEALVNKSLKLLNPITLFVVQSRKRFSLAEVSDAVRLRAEMIAYNSLQAFKSNPDHLFDLKSFVSSLPSAFFPLCLPSSSKSKPGAPVGYSSFETPSALFAAVNDSEFYSPKRIGTRGVSATLVPDLLNNLISLLLTNESNGLESHISRVLEVRRNYYIKLRWSQLLMTTEAVYGPPPSFISGAAPKPTELLKNPGQPATKAEEYWMQIWRIRDQFGIQQIINSSSYGKLGVDVDKLELASKSQRDSSGSEKLKDKVMTKLWSSLDKGLNFIVASKDDKAKQNSADHTPIQTHQDNENANLHPLAPVVSFTSSNEVKQATIRDANELSKQQWEIKQVKTEKETEEIVQSSIRSSRQRSQMGSNADNEPTIYSRIPAQPTLQSPISHSANAHLPSTSQVVQVPHVPSIEQYQSQVSTPSKALHTMIAPNQTEHSHMPVPSTNINRAVTPVPILVQQLPKPILSPFNSNSTTVGSQQSQGTPNGYQANYNPNPETDFPVSGISTPNPRSLGTSSPSPTHFQSHTPAQQIPPPDFGNMSNMPSISNMPAVRTESKEQIDASFSYEQPAQAREVLTPLAPQKPPVSSPKNTTSTKKVDDSSASSSSSGLGAFGAAAASKVMSWFSAPPKAELEDETKFVFDKEAKEWIEVDRNGNRVVRAESDKAPSKTKPEAVKRAPAPLPPPMPMPMPTQMQSRAPLAGGVQSRYALSTGLGTSLEESQPVELPGLLAPQAPLGFE